MTRRAKITPGQVGLPEGTRRRVAGLRREEVAMLAGVSTEYYVQIERGNVAGVSDDVLNAIANALQLGDEESDHLFALARAATTKPSKRRTAARAKSEVPVAIQALMDALVGVPAVVQNGCLDLVGANSLGRAIYSEVFDRAGDSVPNLARFIFLDTAATNVFPDWRKTADDCVGLLHVEAARSPYSTAVTGLVGELATRSADFRERWAAHDIKVHRRGIKKFRHRAVGDLALRFEALEILSSDGLVLVSYTADANTAARDALDLLSMWTATENVMSDNQPTGDSK